MFQDEKDKCEEYVLSLDLAKALSLSERVGGRITEHQVVIYSFINSSVLV